MRCPGLLLDDATKNGPVRLLSKLRLNVRCNARKGSSPWPSCRCTFCVLASLCAPVILLVDRRCDKFSTDPEDQNAMAYHDYYLDDYPGYGSDIAKAMMV